MRNVFLCLTLGGALIAAPAAAQNRDAPLDLPKIEQPDNGLLGVRIPGAPAPDGKTAKPAPRPNNTQRAQSAPKQTGMPVQMLDQTPQKRVDELFDKLKKTGSPMAGQNLAGRISDRWQESGSATIDLMMGWAKDAAEAKKYDIALDFLDQASVMKPDYAEVYNRRASVHYLMGNYAKAMADIDKTLQLEPRHYGALAAMASMLQARGLKQSAVAIYARILTIYPAMREAQGQLQKLSEELEPRAI